MRLPNTINNLLFVLAIGCFCSCQSGKEQIARTPPNLILIIADDMNWDDSGAYGHPHIKTPNIDQLSHDGMRFTQAFLTTSSCSPSRTSIITGKYPHNTDAEQLHWPLPEGQLTFVEQLKDAGYWTGLAGKYHLGDAVRDDFDAIMEFGTAGFQVGPDGKPQKTVGDGSGCESWIPLLKSRPDNQPFFLWLAAIDPHRPYKENILPATHGPDDVIVPPYFPDNQEVRKDLALYYDEISRMDGYVGKVTAALEEQGIAENTFVLFISDNGRPFPRDKTTLYEGGIKTPWIIKWPAKVAAGSKNDNLISSVDIAPTFMKLAGLAPLSGFEGMDFTPLLEPAGKPIRDHIYAEDHWHDFEDYTRAIRTTQFKYIKNFFPELPNTPPADALRGLTFKSMLALKKENRLDEAQLRCFEVPRPTEELYDILKDPNELNNLALNPDYSEVLTDMRGKLDKMREITNDKLPEVRTPDEFDRETGTPTAARIRPRPSKAEMMKK
ncbi:sulfatase [Fulvivirgaceae bacterium BMA12]|uniref:Sulfatase n=1 Tax=Agaribacillus aureus TaxID=3051825 RepID=A0ABT8L6D9_9BACT|nr:sulfatase [Fulvivirgaceae bacterium BMA12]